MWRLRRERRAERTRYRRRGRRRRRCVQGSYGEERSAGGGFELLYDEAIELDAEKQRERRRERRPRAQHPRRQIRGRGEEDCGRAISWAP